MTDVELIEKKLARIEGCLRDLRTLARPAEIATDLLQQRFVEHHLGDIERFIAAIRGRL